MRYKCIFLSVAILIAGGYLSGCTTVPYDEDVSWSSPTAPIALPEPERTGIYHKVKAGETLWRIAKTYDVPINDVIRSNNIPDAAEIEENQLLFIPGAYEQRNIILSSEEKINEFIWPVKGNVVTYFNQWTGGRKSKGIDIQVSPGETVGAARSGRVVFADFLTGYGYTVILDHQDGYYSVYGNNAKLLVKLGDQVIKNSPLTQAGQKQDMAFLHFEIRHHDVEDNPLYYLP